MKKEFRESMLAKQKGEIVLPFQSKLTENNQHLKTKESRHVKPNNSSSSNNDNSKGAKKASRETGGGSSGNGEGEFKLKLRPETGLMGKGKKNKPLIEICEPSASTPASTVTAQSSSPLAAAPTTTAKKTALSASSSPTILMSDPSSTPALSLSSSKPVLKTPEYSIKCDASTVTLAIKLPLLVSRM